jgi:hypothetical protein
MPYPRNRKRSYGKAAPAAAIRHIAERNELSRRFSKIVITPVGTSVKEDRRAKLRAAAARVRGTFSADFKQLGADEIMSFIRGDEPAPGAARRGRR